jgi:hypothetical protein
MESWCGWRIESETKPERKIEMTIKQDLKALQKEFKELGKKVEKLTKAIEKGDTIKVAKKTTAKPVTAKTAKKVPAKKAPAKKKSAQPTAIDKVLKIINGSKKGVDASTLMKKTGFNDKKIRNIIFKAFKEGKIKRVGKGIYVGA